MPQILIVEDDASVSGMLARLLQGKGYQTRVESNGASALLAAHGDLPDLILMDMMMPILEGQTAIQALRHDTRTAHIPIVVLSARDDETTLAEALGAGANVYLKKPPEPQELLALVERLLAMHQKEAKR